MSIFSRASFVGVASLSLLVVAVPVTANATPGFSITKLAPVFGQVGSTVTLHVSGFDSTQPATVEFAAGSTTVGATGTFASPTSLQAAVPSGATTGKLEVIQGLDTARSPKAFVVQLPTTSRLTLSKSAVEYPGRSIVSATVTSASGPAKGQIAKLQHRTRGTSGWFTVKAAGTRTSGNKGVVSWKIQPTQSTFYRAVFIGSHAFASSTTAGSLLSVTPRLTLKIAKNAPELTSVAVTGTVAPAISGPVLLQQKHGNTWKTVETPNAHSGAFTTHLTFGALGALSFRAVRPGDARHLKGISPVRAVQVVERTLQDGDTGPDVLRAQKRLRQLHYDIGSVNGTFGYDMLHAVTAFQKVQGIPDDGVIGPKVWAALSSPKKLHLRDTVLTGDSVQVNLAKQVVILIKNGKIWRIVDASTAGGYEYTDSEGEPEKAITPEGHFSVQYKIDKWVHSKLGYLYKPSYFTDTGYAIHGETEVPPYPASHGCVRITVPAMDRYYNFFYDGESVYIYGKSPLGHE